MSRPSRSGFLALLWLIPMVASIVIRTPGALPGTPYAPPGNATWGFGDFVAGCPAGDTVIVGAPTHPSLLRIEVVYTNASGQPRVGVPPESIWVTVSAASGNIAVNDETRTGSVWKSFASDSTRADGSTRIVFPSCSGCGTLSLTLYVSGVNQGTRQRFGLWTPTRTGA